jgi:hypothetical protein
MANLARQCDRTTGVLQGPPTMPIIHRLRPDSTSVPTTGSKEKDQAGRRCRARRGLEGRRAADKGLRGQGRLRWRRDGRGPFILPLCDCKGLGYPHQLLKCDVSVPELNQPLALAEVVTPPDGAIVGVV